MAAAMRRRLPILLALLLCAGAVPATAAAREQTIAPAAAEGDLLFYRVDLGDSATVRSGWLEGHARTRRLSLPPLLRGVSQHRLRVRLGPHARRRLGARPRLVLALVDPPAPATPGAPEADPGPEPAADLAARAPTVQIGISPAIPLVSDPIPSDCTRYASPTGSDSASGSRAAPFKTSQKLVDSLAPGDVGCLDSGTYYRPILSIRHGGTASDRVVLRSTPGQRALTTGQIWVADSADFVTVAYVDHDATYDTPTARPSPVVNGDDALFYGINVWSNNGVCFYLGDREWGVARRTVIRHSRIHDCGQAGLNKRHGIYIAQAVDTVIEENAIFDNPDRGIQFYPNSQGAIVRHNVIDSNGEGVIFSGVDGDASSDNVVEGNLITDSRLRYNVESWWPEGNPVGSGNVVRGNCIAGGNFGGIQEPQVGFLANNNVFADPGYLDRESKDFRIPPSSPCAAMMDGVQAG
jgi:hypothetical protein